MLGVVEAVFTPEVLAPLLSQPAHPARTGANFLPRRSSTKQEVGGTGLSGKSAQQYGTAAESLTYDRAAQVAIRIRLVRPVASEVELEPIQYAPLVTSERKPPIRKPTETLDSRSPLADTKALPQSNRRGIAALIAGAVAAIGIFIVHSNYKAEEEASKHRIAPTEVEVEGLTLNTAPNALSRQLQGRIRNHSASYTLDSVKLKVTLLETLQNGEGEVVGENDVLVPVAVPPNQTRGVNTYVYFANLPSPRGQFAWSYAVEEIRGH